MRATLDIYRILNRGFLRLTLVSLLLFSAYYAIQRSIILESYHNLSSEYASNARNYVLKNLSLYENELTEITKVIAENNTIGKIINSTGKHRLEEALYVLPHASAVIISDMSGNFTRFPAMTAYEQEIEFDPRTRPWFIRFSNFGMRPHFTLPYQDVFTGQEWFSLSAPIFKKDSSMAGVVALAIKTLPLTQQMSEFVAPAFGTLRVVDREGHFILGKPSDEQLNPLLLKGEEGYFETDSSWFYFSSLSYPAWYLVHEVPKEMMTKLVDEESQTVVYSALFAMLILLAGWAGMRFVAQRIEKVLMSAILQHSEGDLPSAMESMYQKRRKLRIEAMRDGLTGLLNRRAFELHLNTLYADGTACSMALLDIDNFKSINDKFGHPIGDEVIKRLAVLADKLLKHHSTKVFRYGGEEFAILFTDVNSVAALAMLENLRQAFEREKWPEGLQKVTFSAGFKMKTGEDQQHFIAATDALLYVAKKQGKNRIVHNSR